jgi:spore germination cell wall hydrolase CwlJ-like protein
LTAWFGAAEGAKQSLSVSDGNLGLAIPPGPLEQIYLPLSVSQAEAENALIPVANTPIEAANPLILNSASLGPLEFRASMECLTAAIYYEAGSEGEAGKRAVAQVVLNRARHPAFPNSICSVVYQGSERTTGCQFTFTCDGSLSRKPTTTGWANARRIATEALSGYVERTVGMATHYHAEYVVPYWARSLNKIGNLGVHIFYRWDGAWGLKRAFKQAVVADERGIGSTIDLILPPDDTLRSQIELLSSDTKISIPPLNAPLNEDRSAGTLAVKDAGGSVGNVSNSALQADQERGELALDRNSSVLAH